MVPLVSKIFNVVFSMSSVDSMFITEELLTMVGWIPMVACLIVKSAVAEGDLISVEMLLLTTWNRSFSFFQITVTISKSSGFQLAFSDLEKL